MLTGQQKYPIFPQDPEQVYFVCLLLLVTQNYRRYISIPTILLEIWKENSPGLEMAVIKVSFR